MTTVPNPAVPDLSDPTPTGGEDAHTIMVNRVSWGAIFAGVVVGLVVQVLLTMLGVGIGAATIDPATNGSPAASTFSMASGIWYVVSGIIAAFAGGYIAARMSGKTVATTGALHGLTTWAFTTLLVLYLLSTAVGSIVGGTFSGVAGAVGGLGQTVAQAAGPMLQDANPIDAIQNQIRATGNDPEALNTAAMNAMRALVTGDEAGADQARQQAAQALANARGIPLDQAQSRSRRWRSNIVRRSIRRSRPRRSLPSRLPRWSRAARSWRSWRCCSAPSPAGSAAAQGSCIRSSPIVWCPPAGRWSEHGSRRRRAHASRWPRRRRWSPSARR